MTERQLSLKDLLEIAKLGPSAIKAVQTAFEFEQAINKIQNAHLNGTLEQRMDDILKANEQDGTG